MPTTISGAPSPLRSAMRPFTGEYPRFVGTPCSGPSSTREPRINVTVRVLPPAVWDVNVPAWRLQIASPGPNRHFEPAGAAERIPEARHGLVHLSVCGHTGVCRSGKRVVPQPRFSLSPRVRSIKTIIFIEIYAAPFGG